MLSLIHISGEAAEEKIVVQGIADCVFVEDGKLVFVDYKTDTGVDAEALLDRYSAQLGIYREALSQLSLIHILYLLCYVDGLFDYRRYRLLLREHIFVEVPDVNEADYIVRVVRIDRQAREAGVVEHRGYFFDAVVF